MNSKTKVCHLSTVHECWDVRIKNRECSSLAKAGFDVHLFATDGKSTQSNGVTVHNLIKFDNRIRRYFYSYKCIREIIKLNPVIIHFHDPELISVMLKVKKKHKNIKIIFDCHEDSISHIDLKNYIPYLVKPVVKKYLKIKFQTAAKYFDAIITADHGVNKIFKNFGAKPITLYNFPPREIYSKQLNWSFSNRTYDVIYPGSTPNYHLMTMFKIADRLKKMKIETKWLILTQYAFKNKAWIDEMLSYFNIKENFIFRPLVPLCKLPAYLNQAKIGIIPLPDVKKFHKNIPSKLFDYLMAGLPVVLSDLPPTRNFINGLGIAIPVKPDDIKEYSTTIAQLLKNEKEMIRMGQRGRKMAMNKFSWETQEPVLIKLYNELLQQ